MQTILTKGASLTKRELEIVTLVAEGPTNKEIADRLCTSQATVRTHLTSVFVNLGITNRLKPVIYVFGHRLIDPHVKNTNFVGYGLRQSVYRH